MSYTMYIHTRTIFGAGKIKELHNQPMPGTRPLLVISSGKSVKENGTFYTVMNELAHAGLDPVVYDRAQANLLKSTVMEGAEFAWSNHCDFIVALVGG